MPEFNSMLVLHSDWQIFKVFKQWNACQLKINGSSFQSLIRTKRHRRLRRHRKVMSKHFNRLLRVKHGVFEYTMKNIDGLGMCVLWNRLDHNNQPNAFSTMSDDEKYKALRSITKIERKVGIPKNKLEIGEIYHVDGRNFNMAFWSGTVFEGIRHKFGSSFMSPEYHWDDGPPYGTCVPLSKIERIPTETTSELDDTE